MSKLEIPSAEFTPELVSGSVKTAMKDAGAKSADLWKVHPSKLRVIEGFNGRIRTPAYEEHLQRIKQSIIENGYYPDKPLAGYVAKEGDENVIYVTEGHTRHEAVQLVMHQPHQQGHDHHRDGSQIGDGADEGTAVFGTHAVRNRNTPLGKKRGGQAGFWWCRNPFCQLTES